MHKLSMIIALPKHRRVCVEQEKAVRECYDSAPDDVNDVTVSLDGMWQRRGFSLLNTRRFARRGQIYLNHDVIGNIGSSGHERGGGVT